MQTDRTTRMERLFQVQTRAVEAPGEDAIQQELYVEGYAVRFDSPTVLFEYSGTEYKEQIDRHAFDGALMEDVSSTTTMAARCWHGPATIRCG